MLRSLFSILLACVAALPLVPVESRAQDQGPNPLMVKHRNDCRMAAQVLITGEPRTRREWALDYISNCEHEGPPAIVQEWRTVPGDTASVVKVMRASTMIHDARIYEQVRAVVLDRSRPDVVRVGAMHVLDNYVDPHHVGWFSAVPVVGAANVQVLPAGGVVTHAPYTNGPVPLTGSVKAPVLDLLQRIGAAREVESVSVWYAASALARRIQQEIEWRN
ncbi:MAG TPA: hypothetical protein VF710_00045 [Longimicrobium sp.]|jgi:hypothetical protein